MSADNGYLIRENSQGKFVFQMYFQSDDEYPSIDDDRALTFDTLQEAVDYYGRHMHDECVSEHGLKIDIDLQPGNFYPLLRPYPEFCPECGPGYRYGDEGCRHSPKQKKENNNMQLQQFTRKPLVVEGVQVTEENFQEVAEWCNGGSYNEPKGKYIKVDVQNPLTPRQTKAFVGDWVLKSNRGFKVYTETGLKNAFSEPEEETGSDPEAVAPGQAVYFSGTRGNIFETPPQELQVTNEPVDPREQISGSST